MIQQKLYLGSEWDIEKQIEKADKQTAKLKILGFCEECNIAVRQENKGCELDFKGSNEWLCKDCAEKTQLKAD